MSLHLVTTSAALTRPFALPFSCTRDGRPIVAVAATGDDGSNSSLSLRSSGAVYVFGQDPSTLNFTMPTVLRPTVEAVNLNFGIDLAFDDACTRLGVASYGRDYAGEATVYNVNKDGKAAFVETVRSRTSTSFDYAGQGLVWGSDFLGFAAYGDDTAGSSAGAFYAMTRQLVV